MDVENKAPVKRSKKKSKKKISSNKLIISFLVIAVVLACVATGIHFLTRLTNKSFENCSLGDVNGDGYITAADALDIIKYTIGVTDLFDSQKLLADVDGDGDVTSTDSLVLLRYSVGEITVLPYSSSSANNTMPANGKQLVYTSDNSVTTVRISNEWEASNGKKSYQLIVTVQNTGTENINSWSSSISLSNEAKLSRKWDCDASVSGTEVKISGDNIPVRSTVTCGLIVTGEYEISINNLETE